MSKNTLILIAVFSTLLNAGIYLYKNKTSSDQGWKWNDDWPVENNPPIIMTPPPTETKPPQSQTLKTTNDYYDAVKLAKDNSKSSILLFFKSEGCSWCKKMDSEIFQNPDSQTINDLNNTVVCFIDTADPKNRELCKKLNISGIPSYAIIDVNANKTLKLSSGYIPKNQFLAWSKTTYSPVDFSDKPIKKEVPKEDIEVKPVYSEPLYRNGQGIIFCPSCR